MRIMKSIGLMLMILTLLAIGSVSAQSETSSSGPTLTLTEADINASFQLSVPNSSSVTDVTLNGVDLLSTGEVQISFSATFHSPNGEDRQLNIIAILIGLLRSRGTVYQLQQATITNVTDGTSNTIMFGESEARRYSFIANAFNRYLRAEAQAAGIRGRTETVSNDESITLLGH